MTPTEATRGRGAVERLVSALLRPVDLGWLAAFRVLLRARAGRLDVALPRVRVDRALLRHASLSFQVLGLRVGRAALPRGHAHACSPCSRCSPSRWPPASRFGLSAFLFAAGFSYVQLIDVSTYLNHYYLAALLAWLLCALACRARLVARRPRSPRSSAELARSEQSRRCLALPLPLPGGRGLRVRGARQGAAGLAAPRSAAPHLARRERRAPRRGAAARRRGRAAPDELGRLPLRYHHRRLALVELSKTRPYAYAVVLVFTR